MGVHKLSDGRWFLEHRVEGKKRREYFGRGLQAEAAARARFSELELRPYGQVRRKSGPTFREVVRAYLLDRQESLADSTIAGMLPKIESIYLPALGDILATNVNETRIRQYVDERCRLVKRTTVHRELSDIRAILNWAVKKRVIASNNMAGATFPKRDDERIRPPSSEEVKRILEHSPDHLRRCLLIGWFCGLRMGEELFSLKWHAVDWDRQQLFIVSADKGGLPDRPVPIASIFLPHLAKWFAEDGEKDDLHIIRWNGKRIYKIKTAWAKAKAKAGITRRLRPYDLRHSFATDLMDAGADCNTVGDLMGHKDKSTTAYVYNHVSASRSRAVIEKRKSILE
jgi:integrase